MTFKSLGLRTGSYGSLQQQQQQQQPSNGVLQNASPLFSRKPSKLQLSSYREKEKERCFSCVCRHLCRRKVGMVILVGLALLAFVFGCFMVNKETPGNDITDISDVIPLDLPTSTKRSYKKENSFNSQITMKENDGTPLSLKELPLHTCKNFHFSPPPPSNRRRIGPRPCPVCYLPVKHAVASMPISPSPSPMLRNLSYVYDENPAKTEPHGGSDFGGYPSMKQRNDSFDIKESMTVHCGFVKGTRPGRGSGFDIDEADLSELDKYHDVIVASAIFGNYDVIQEPENISDTARSLVPFFMFIDQETEEYMRNKSMLNSSKMIGLWRIIVVRNVPYGDSRRNGKVPKLLLHRLFPKARYSIWIDGKLKLVQDPYRILERFLWRENATFAISRHYRRFDVFEEAEANKAGGKYDNASIDYQIDFYQKEGLTQYSLAKLPITSDVPEGCVIIREHIPITNLFTCQWFNEVDRFTSRDQLSFSTVRDKIISKVSWSINMFLDCERRNFVIQAYHRELLEHMPPPPPPPRITVHHQPPPVHPLPIIHRDTPIAKPVRKKPPSKRKSRRHRKVIAGSRESSFF